MIFLSTKFKIKCASFLSKILIFFLGKNNRIVLRNNIKYEIDLNEGIDLGIFLNIKNEESILNIKRVINQKKRGIILDIGSNVGSVTLPLAKLFNNSKIISIEPTLYAFSKLKKNINLNPNLKKRIKLENSLVSFKTKSVKEVHSSWNFSNNQKKHHIHLGALRKTSGKTTTLDKICSKLRSVDFIKIDVDGYELSVLKSGKKIINKYRPIIYFEFAPYLYKEFNYTPKALINFIKRDLNYIFYSEHFKKVLNIDNFIKKLKNRSQNFFLVHKNTKV